MGCTHSMLLFRGCFRFFRGADLLLWAWLLVYFFSRTSPERREVTSAGARGRRLERWPARHLCGGTIPGREDLCRLRLLAQQPEFFPDALWNFADACVRDFCVVPLGTGRRRDLARDSDGANFAAGVLGAHRVRLWAAIDFAEGAQQHRAVDVGMVVIFAAMLGLSIWRTNAKKPRGAEIERRRRHRVRRRQCKSYFVEGVETKAWWPAPEAATAIAES